MIFSLRVMNGVTALELVVWEFLIGQFLTSKFFYCKSCSFHALVVLYIMYRYYFLMCIIMYSEIPIALEQRKNFEFAI